jgi:cytochrome c biogenesis protein CcmG/thiol:disulfide interchange protein DsbE
MAADGEGAGGAPGAVRARARRRALGVAAVLLVLFLLNAVWIARSVRGLQRGAPVAGAPAPGFQGPLLGGGRLDLAGLRGKVVLLDFWATWCAPCVAEVPALVRAQERLGPRGLAIVGVDIEGPSAERAVADFVAESGIRYPVVIDDGPIATLYRVRALPHAFVIGRDGVIRKVLVGATPEDELTRALEEALR